MPTTTNFGWTTPADTDLVKDGAAAIRTALGGVDTSFDDLKGGTTGQLLAKASNTDLDYTWVAPTTGDITGVSVTSPITGGGTSGDVTIGISSSAVVPSQTGNSGKYLTTDGTTSSWGTISAGAYTSLATGSLTGNQVTISSISSSYRALVLVINNLSLSNSDEFAIRLNGQTSGYGFGNTRGGSSAGQYETQNGSVIKVPAGNLSAPTTNYRAVIEFPDYATSGLLFCNFTGAANFSSTTTGVQPFGGYGSNTSEAVLSSITLMANYGSGAYTFDNGTYTLYGVK